MERLYAQRALVVSFYSYVSKTQSEEDSYAIVTETLVIVLWFHLYLFIQRFSLTFEIKMTNNFIYQSACQHWRASHRLWHLRAYLSLGAVRLARGFAANDRERLSNTFRSLRLAWKPPGGALRKKAFWAIPSLKSRHVWIRIYSNAMSHKAERFTWKKKNSESQTMCRNEEQL